MLSLTATVMHACDSRFSLYRSVLTFVYHVLLGKLNDCFSSNWCIVPSKDCWLLVKMVNWMIASLLIDVLCHLRIVDSLVKIVIWVWFSYLCPCNAWYMWPSPAVRREGFSSYLYWCIALGKWCGEFCFWESKIFSFTIH